MGTLLPPKIVNWYAAGDGLTGRVAAWPVPGVGFPMTDVQKIYDERMAALTPKERMERASAMLKWAREFIARQIREAEPGCDEELLKLKVARRMYSTNAGAIALIQEEIDRVSHRSL